MTVELYLGDCLDIRPTLGLHRKSVVMTDPPWGINLDTDYSKWPGGIAYESLKGDQRPFDFSPFWTCPAEEQFWFGAECYINFPRGTGTWICWDKYPTDKNDKRFAGAFELIWRKKCGKRRIAKIKAVNTSWVTVKERCGHPNQKPVELMRWLIEEYTKPGQTIVDFYMGSGTTGVACVKAGRNFIGIEIDPRYFEIAKSRIEKAQLEMVQGKFAT